jgi:hypothetical protein
MYLDGVLRNGKKVPIRESMAFYRSTKENIKIILAADSKSEGDQWLRTHNLKQFDDIVGDEVPMVAPTLQISQAEYIRSQGQGKLSMVITADPELAKELLERGFTVMLFLNPLYADPASRPDSSEGRRKWEDITSAIDRQQELFMEDPRT